MTAFEISFSSILESPYVDIPFESFCGDGICSEGENCSNCPTDCGSCVGGSDPVSDSSGGTSNSPSSSPGLSKQDVSECVSNWTNCYWTECKNNLSYFECFDINRCEDEISKVFDTRSCDSFEESFDFFPESNSSGEDRKSRSGFALYSTISILVVLLLVVVSLIIYLLYKNRSSDSSEEKKDSVTKVMGSPLYPYLLENLDKYPLESLREKAISGGYSEKEFDEIVRVLKGK